MRATTTPIAKASAPAARRRVIIAVVALGIVSLAVFGYQRWGRSAAHVAELPQADLSRQESAVVTAIHQAENAVRRNPRSAEAWGHLAALYDLHFFFAEAIACYRQAADLDPSNFRWPYFWGFCARVANQEEAVAQLQRAAALRPDYAPIHVYLAQALEGLGKLDEAQEHFQRTAELDPTSAHALLGLARLALAHGDVQTALAHAKEAAQADPRFADVHAFLAQLHRRAGDPQAAERESVLAANSQKTSPIRDPVRAGLYGQGMDAVWHLDRGAALMKAGKLDGALAEFRAAVEGDPNSPFAHFQLGSALMRSDRFDAAEPHFRKAVELWPRYADAYTNLGVVLGRQNKVNEAVEAFEAALRAKPRMAEAHYNLGDALIRTGRLQEGVQHLREAALAWPDRPDVYFALGKALCTAGQPEEAVASLRRALELEPQKVETLVLLGMALGQAVRADEAVAAFRQALQLQPKQADIYHNLGIALSQSGQFEEAIRTFRQGTVLAPSNLAMIDKLAWLLATCPEAGLRNGAEAMQLAQRVCAASGFKTPQFLDTLGAACAEAGDFDKAARCAERAIQVLRSSAAPPAGLVAQVQARLELYRGRQAFHMPAP